MLPRGCPTRDDPLRFVLDIMIGEGKDMTAKLVPGTTTAIGSLPHTDPAKAARFVLESGCDIPFWPQLPKRNFREWMVPQYASAFPGFTLDEEGKRFRVERGTDFVEELTAFYEKALDPEAEFPLDDEFAAGFGALEAALASCDAKPAFVKGHVTGPLTFLLGLNTEDGRPVHADPELRQAALMLLSKNAAWQARKLKPLAAEGVLVFMDEPIYSALGTAAYLSIKEDDVRETVNEIARAVHDAGGIVGLHCCGSADWETVLSSDIDVLAFDAWGYTDSLAIYPKAVGGFLARGGTLALGSVPTTADDLAGADEAAVIAVGERVIETLSAKGVDAAAIRAQSILTPSCGCGSLSIKDATTVFRLLRAAGDHWKRAAE